eukprot:scaffold803_cov310-Pinguiococcus_pyrenoidosus.AAC.84
MQTPALVVLVEDQVVQPPPGQAESQAHLDAFHQRQRDDGGDGVRHAAAFPSRRQHREQKHPNRRQDARRERLQGSTGSAVDLLLHTCASRQYLVQRQVLRNGHSADILHGLHGDGDSEDRATHDVVDPGADEGGANVQVDMLREADLEESRGEPPAPDLALRCGLSDQEGDENAQLSPLRAQPLHAVAARHAALGSGAMRPEQLHSGRCCGRRGESGEVQVHALCEL